MKNKIPVPILHKDFNKAFAPFAYKDSFNIKNALSYSVVMVVPPVPVIFSNFSQQTLKFLHAYNLAFFVKIFNNYLFNLHKKTISP